MTSAPIYGTMSHWNGDEWRWRRWEAPGSAPGPQTISVIEPLEEPEKPAAAHRLPFGFSRALDPTPDRPAEPLRWEGDDA